MTEYNKLVRDRIPEIIERQGAKPIIALVKGPDLLEMLFAKLREECEELRKDRNAEEFADVLEVLMACSKSMGLDWSEVEALRHEKLGARGGFEKGIVLRMVQEQNCPIENESA